jgi:hypothetical protein
VLDQRRTTPSFQSVPVAVMPVTHAVDHDVDVIRRGAGAVAVADLEDDPRGRGPRAWRDARVDELRRASGCGERRADVGEDDHERRPDRDREGRERATVPGTTLDRHALAASAPGTWARAEATFGGGRTGRNGTGVPPPESRARGIVPRARCPRTPNGEERCGPGRLVGRTARTP